MDNSKIKILYVDDESTNLELFEMVFQDTFEVHIAISPKEGLEAVNRNHDFKFVISDMKMPEMDGLEFVKEVKKNNNSMPCLILSGFQETDEIFDARKENIIVDYMMKPLDREKILTLVHRYAS